MAFEERKKRKEKMKEEKGLEQDSSHLSAV